MKPPHRRRAQLWHALLRDCTVLPATHAFIHEWNEPQLSFGNHHWLCRVGQKNQVIAFCLLALGFEDAVFPFTVKDKPLASTRTALNFG